MCTDTIFTNLARRDWLIESPLNDVVTSYVKALHDQHYAYNTIRIYLDCLAHFGFWLNTGGIKLRHIDSYLVKRFLQEHLPACTCHKPCNSSIGSAGAALRHLLRVLSCSQPLSAMVRNSLTLELDRFGEYLTEICGLASATREYRVQHAEAFLSHAFGTEALVISQLSATDVDVFFVSQQHIGLASKMGMDTVGFLMMAHMTSPEKILEQAQLMVSYGANCIYATDSAGYMLPDHVTARIGLLRSELPANVEVGFHGHHNLGMGIANSLAAIEAGASRIDGSVAGLGAGAGNTPLEVLCAVLDRMGVETGIDLFKIMDVAEDLVVPMMDHPVRVDRNSLTLGYAGVYSSFLLFAKRAEDKYDISARDLLVELGRRGTVGGQEDMIEDLALTMAKEKGLI